MLKAHPSDSKSAIVQPAAYEGRESVQNVNYRCPVCGRMVDATSAEQILLHHEHVTHPQDFAALKPVARTDRQLGLFDNQRMAHP